MGRIKDNLNELSEEDKKNLFENHIGLLIFFAKKYFRLCRPLEFMELINEGYFGLIRAAELFDETRGIKFSSYAGSFIRSYLGALAWKQRRQEAVFKLYFGIVSSNSSQKKEKLGEEQREIVTDDFLRKHLSPIELTAIKLTFGLGTKRLSSREAGRRMGCSGTTVCSIVKEALAKLKKL